MTRLALVTLSRHEYADALAYAERALGYGTGQLFPHAILGDTYFEIGEYDKAAVTYAKLTTLDRRRVPLDATGALHPCGERARGDRRDGTGRRGAPQATRRRARTWRGRSPASGSSTSGPGDLAAAEAAYRNAGNSTRVPLGARRPGESARGAEAVRGRDQAIPAGHRCDPAAAVRGGSRRRLHEAQPAREAAKQYALVEYIGQLNAINKEIYNRDLASSTPITT